MQTPSFFKSVGSPAFTVGEPGRVGPAWLQWGLGLGAALVAAPVAFLLVQGVAGLLVSAAVGYVGIRVAPVLALNLTYWQRGALRRTVQGNCLSAIEQQEIDDGAQHEKFLAQSVAEEGALIAAINGARVDMAAHPELAADFQRLVDDLELQKADCIRERCVAIGEREREQHAFTINRAKAKAVELGQARDAHRQRQMTAGPDRRWLRITAADAIEQGMQSMAARRRMTLDAINDVPRSPGAIARSGSSQAGDSP